MNKSGAFIKVLTVTISLLLWSCTDSDDNDNTTPPDWSDWEGGCDGDLSGDIGAGTSWQWQLTETIDTTLDVQVYDVDLFEVPEATVELLKDDGKMVICYFSAGTWEDWRDDAADFPAAVLGNAMEEWQDEKWLDVRSQDVIDIMKLRLDYAVTLGCDGVEPDNMDGYLPDNSSGFDFDGFDQLTYNQLIAEEAHDRGLSVGLKNDVDQLVELEPCYDWALNEECLNYDECNRYKPFVDEGKVVFHVEYVDSHGDGQALADSICGNTTLTGFSTLIKDWDLTAWVIPCP